MKKIKYLIMQYFFMLLFFIGGCSQTVQANMETGLRKTNWLKELQIDWLDDGRNIFGLTATEVNKLETIADSSRGTAGAQARGILLFAYDSLYSYINCPSMPDTSYKSAEFKGKVDNNPVGLSIFVKPNPADGVVSFIYSLPIEENTAILKLYDSNGRIIKTFVLPTDKKSLNYNCSGLKPGIYIYSLSSGKHISTGKFVVAR